ncbi:hypothetical protein ACCO45_008843 [Purpureocillium lilacinum]|uniref:Uncharacterized protein n=1 Tax=Purpureocillium lilacinum TaxID=33203 RepID=A0ACC4DJG6_PURLI
MKTPSRPPFSLPPASSSTPIRRPSPNPSSASPSVGPSLTKLSRADHRTLVEKRTWLQTHKVAVPSIWRAAPSSSRASRHKATPCNDTVASTNSSSSSIATGTPVDATLVFAQQEAGTAVCLSRAVSSSPAPTASPTPPTTSPSPARTGCSSPPARSSPPWQSPGTRTATSPSCSSRAAPRLRPGPWSSRSSCPSRTSASRPPPPSRRPLVCIGHPAAEDLEHPVAGTQTGYDVLVVSTGPTAAWPQARARIRIQTQTKTWVRTRASTKTPRTTPTLAPSCTTAGPTGATAARPRRAPRRRGARRPALELGRRDGHAQGRAVGGRHGVPRRVRRAVRGPGGGRLALVREMK